MELPSFLTHPNPQRYLSENYIVIDFETTTIGKGLAVYPANRIIGVAFRYGPSHPRSRKNAMDVRQGNETYWRSAGEYELGSLVEDIKSADFLVAHNAKFELGWLARCGLDLSNVLVYDTQIGEYVLGGNRYALWDLGLDKISKRRFGGGKLSLISKLWDAGIPTEEIPTEWLSRYCAVDVALTERLFLEQRTELHLKGLLPVLYNRCLLTPVLADIERNGMQLDEKIVHTKTKVREKAYAKTQRILDSFAGGINWSSKLQLADFLYTKLAFPEVQVRKGGRWYPDRTSTGRPKTDVDTILKLKGKTEEQIYFLRVYKKHNELGNELTKYLRKFADCCASDAMGRLFAQFNQCNTRTHRLSSSGLEYRAQLHNIPRAYKPMFRASKPGWIVGEADGAQLEFRTAVHLGRDKQGLFDIAMGVDIHLVTASVIWPHLLAKSKRQEGKEHTFKPLYGGQSGTDDERRYYRFFQEKYAGVTSAQSKWKDEVLCTKKLRTEWGLVYYWPDTSMDRNGYIKNSTAICNYPVQAFATAEIIPIALVWFWHRLKRSTLQMYLVNSVHDSIVAELPEAEVEDFRRLSEQCLIDDVYSFLWKLYGIKLTVPLGCGITHGTNWGNKKNEVKIEAKKEFWWDAANDSDMVTLLQAA